ncbi:MAG: class I adenylate-forming enzyme family protein [Nocardioides sp.]
MTGTHNLAVLAEQSFERLGDYESLFFEGRWHTSGSIHDRAARVAEGLRAQGVEPGDRVIVLTMNTPEVFVSYQAIWRAGAVVTPVIFLQTPPELRHILEDSGAKAAILTPELLPLFQGSAEGLGITAIVVDGDGADGTVPFSVLEAAQPGEIVSREDDDLAALLYTGGTTGRAKGVMLSHRNLWEAGAGMNKVTESSGTTRSLLPLPLSHAFGLNVLVSGMHSEKQHVSVMQRWFDPAGWLQLVQDHRLEASPVVPSMMGMLLDQPYADFDLSSLVSFGSGGAPLLPHLREKVEAAFGVKIVEGYGCTETSAIVTASSVDDIRPGSVGRPAPHMEVSIQSPTGEILGADEEGEICVRGLGIMLGYWHEPDLTAETIRDGWLHTGDVGRLDQDGYLYVVDRVKDLIIRGGFNVYPRDVEDVLIEHEAVASAACVGKPDEESGEEVVAVVQLHPGHTVTSAELIEYAKERMARYKYPREVRIIDAVPLTSVGKINRKAVRELVRE